MVERTVLVGVVAHKHARWHRPLDKIAPKEREKIRLAAVRVSGSGFRVVSRVIGWDSVGSGIRFDTFLSDNVIKRIRESFQ